MGGLSISTFLRVATRSAGVLSLSIFAITPAVAEESWTSQYGLYRLSYSSELDPIDINRIHRWTLRLETADKHAVVGANIVVGGGMPDHDHGLPTSPQVTSDLGDGSYLLEGMRFHMNGYWEITVSIEAEKGSDTVVIRLDI